MEIHTLSKTPEITLHRQKIELIGVNSEKIIWFYAISNYHQIEKHQVFNYSYSLENEKIIYEAIFKVEKLICRGIEVDIVEKRTEFKIGFYYSADIQKISDFLESNNMTLAKDVEGENKVCLSKVISMTTIEDTRLIRHLKNVKLSVLEEYFIGRAGEVIEKGETFDYYLNYEGLESIENINWKLIEISSPPSRKANYMYPRVPYLVKFLKSENTKLSNRNIFLIGKRIYPF